MAKYGCEEWQLEDYYGREKADRLRDTLDKLWSSNQPFSYPSRIFYAKGNTKKRGIEYILVSWDSLCESQINEICNQLDIDREKIIYIQ